MGETTNTESTENTTTGNTRETAIAAISMPDLDERRAILIRDYKDCAARKKRLLKDFRSEQEGLQKNIIKTDIISLIDRQKHLSEAIDNLNKYKLDVSNAEHHRVLQSTQLDMVKSWPAVPDLRVTDHDYQTVAARLAQSRQQQNVLTERQALLSIACKGEEPSTAIKLAELEFNALIKESERLTKEEKKTDELAEVELAGPEYQRKEERKTDHGLSHKNKHSKKKRTEVVDLLEGFDVSSY